jgi:hypothetical protein
MNKTLTIEEKTQSQTSSDDSCHDRECVYYLETYVKKDRLVRELLPLGPSDQESAHNRYCYYARGYYDICKVILNLRWSIVL